MPTGSDDIAAIPAGDASSTASVAASGGGESGGGGGGSGGAFTISATKGTSTSGCTITWTAQSGATGYRVVRGTPSNMDNASILVETVTGTSYTDTIGTAGKTYYYWVVAKKSSGYVTSSYATGYKASSSSGGGESGGGSTSTSVPYTVAFNANGGTGTMANLSFAAGASKALTICTFTRTGYLFIGWAKTASATTSAYDDGECVYEDGLDFQGLGGDRRRNRSKIYRQTVREESCDSGNEESLRRVASIWCTALGEWPLLGGS